jgi:hypothetical protein
VYEEVVFGGRAIVAISVGAVAGGLSVSAMASTLPPAACIPIYPLSQSAGRLGCTV